MVERLRGMFAFAIWDRDRRGVFLARDPLGIKPLYVADDGRTLRFASQVKALMAGGGLSTDPEPAAEVGFLMWGSVPEPFSLYRAIRSLPAGHTLWRPTTGAATTRRYHSIAGVFAAAEAAGPAPTGVARTDMVRAAVADTMRHHMVADVPVGAFLSGGLDSSAIVEFAARASPQTLRTVTLGFDEFRDGPSDETRIAAATAGTLGVEHRTVWVTRDEFASRRDHLLESMDQPSIDGTNSYFVSLAAASTGLKVVRTG